MKNFLIFISIFIILFFQIGIFPHLEIKGLFPNLILVSVLCLSVSQGWKKTLPWTILGGFFLDFYSLNYFIGISILGLFLSSSLIYFLSQSLLKKTNFSSLLLNFLIAIFSYYFLLFIFSKIFVLNLNFSFLNFIIIIIYNLIFVLPLFNLYQFLRKFKNHARKIKKI